METPPWVFCWVTARGPVGNGSDLAGRRRFEREELEQMTIEVSIGEMVINSRLGDYAVLVLLIVLLRATKKNRR